MENHTPKRILIIEDDSHIAEGLRLNLTILGHEVLISGDGVSGLERWKDWHPDLIVLDVMLPGIDGFKVLQSIRLEDERIPVLILSARSEIEDRVKGLSYGVDDYLPKPFDLEEFLLRVDRLLTRCSWYRSQINTDVTEPVNGPDKIFSFGRNRINFDTAVAHCGEEIIHLTGQELKLLKLFAANPGRPLSRQTLLQVGWGYTKGMTTRTVDNFIVRFRKYFEEDPKNPVYFRSLRSVGYVFDPEGSKGQMQTLST